MRHNIFILLLLMFLSHDSNVYCVTLADHKTSKIEVDFFRFLFPFDEFFNDNSSITYQNNTSISTSVPVFNSTITLPIQTETPIQNSSQTTTSILTSTSSTSNLTTTALVTTTTVHTSITTTATVSSVIPSTTTALLTTSQFFPTLNLSLDQIQPPSDYIIHKLYRKYLEQKKRQLSFPSIKINPSQIVNTNIPDDLNVCTDQYSTNENGNTYCVDSVGEKRPVYEVDCKFPFQYKGVWYDTCTKTDSPQFWCSIDTIFASKYAFCKEECPRLAKKLMTGPDSKFTHTSCLPRNSQAISYFPDEDKINKIVMQHNTIRSSVHTAADLTSLSWDFGLARIAQRKADTCTFSHDCEKCRVPLNNRTTYVGQNAFTSSGYSELIWTDVIILWASTGASFNYGGPQAGDVRQYTQLVSNLASKVGCGASKCGTNFYVYCNYATGQIDINRPYTTGTSCSSCPAFCSNNLCQCNKYCQNGGTLDLKTCSCKCPAYTSGAECENLVCSKDDKSYGCWASDASYCSYSNIPPICPNLCKVCKIT